MSFAAGTVLARRYVLRESIAAGGYGEVWRGTDLLLDPPVAVKLLLSAHARHGDTGQVPRGGQARRGWPTRTSRGSTTTSNRIPLARPSW